MHNSGAKLIKKNEIGVKCKKNYTLLFELYKKKGFKCEKLAFLSKKNENDVFTHIVLLNFSVNVNSKL